MSINFLNAFMRKNIEFKVDFILSFLRWRQCGSRVFKTFKNIKKAFKTLQGFKEAKKIKESK